jgi:ribosomal protein L11 methylase PrmA
VSGATENNSSSAALATNQSSSVQPDAGSYRDPRGRIFYADGRVFRTVMPIAVADYEFVRDSGLLQTLEQEELVIAAKEANPSVIGSAGNGAAYVLEHPVIPFISYPYEWSFPALKNAALTHLDLNLRLLDANINLCDSSAYNIQFNGAKSIFIDYLSFRKYQDGEYWTSHRQFCEQFLNPLLLRSLLGVSHNAWYRGNQEGIPTPEFAQLIPFRKKWSWNVQTNVMLQTKFEKSASAADVSKLAASIERRKLPKTTLTSMMQGLRNWIARLEPLNRGTTTWADYSVSNSYADEETKAKVAFIKAFASEVKPRQCWDLGCNTGEYSKVALDSGASYVIGFDSDQGAIEQAFARAGSEKLNFLPLFMDATNETPDQGWAGKERKGLASRQSADAIICLAFVHHMVISANIPFDQLIDRLIRLAPDGIIEFVPKSDSKVQELLRLREDIFPDYTEEFFISSISAHADIIKSEKITQTGRLLVQYKRH